MLNIDIQKGDMFLVDSNKTGPKIVKFFMTAKTIWLHLWRKLRGTQETVYYYHVGMFSDKYNIIEQQSKVILRSADKLLNTGNEVLIVRRKGITKLEQAQLLAIAMDDLGEGYDILSIFGKLFTWLTGIPYFARYIQWPQAEICINRVAYWFKRAQGDTFGAKTHSELTTHILWKYIMNHPDEWKIIYQGIPRNEK